MVNANASEMNLKGYLKTKANAVVQEVESVDVSGNRIEFTESTKTVFTPNEAQQTPEKKVDQKPNQKPGQAPEQTQEQKSESSPDQISGQKVEQTTEQKSSYF